MSHRPNNSLIAFYCFTGLWSFNATSGLWILYLIHCHWSLFQIGIAEAGFHLVSFMSDVPTGAFADRFGRRQSLMIGLLIGSTIPVMTFVLAPRSVFLGVLSISLGALSWTFIGGADQALLYGLTQSQPLSYARIYGRVAALSLGATGIAIVVGGFLVIHGGWIYPYLLTAATNLMAMTPMMWIPRPGIEEHKSEASVLTAIKGASRLASQDAALLLLVAIGATVATLSTINNLYAQAMLQHKGISLTVIDVLISLGTGIAASGSIVGGHLAYRRRRQRFGSGLIIYGLAMVAIGIFPVTEAVSGYLLGSGVDGVIDPIYEAELNEKAPEEYRATILSLPGAGFSLGMMILFPLAGWLMGHGLWVSVYGTMGMALFLIGAMVLLASHRKKSGQTNTMSTK